MSEVYNPEVELYERLEALTLEAQRLVRKRDEATNAGDRQVLERQLHEVEERIDLLRKRLKPDK